MIKIKLGRRGSALVSCVFFALLFLLGSIASAQNASTKAASSSSAVEAIAQRPLIIGVHISPPFVMMKEGQLAGMAIQLWENTAARLNLSFTYKPYDTVADMLKALADGNIDVAVENLSISSSRLEQFDFTQSWYDSGMRIMIKESRQSNFSKVLERLKKSGYLYSYAWLAALLLCATLGLTIVDRRFDKDFTRHWGRGLADNFFHVVSATSTGRASHKPLFGSVGRVLAALWILSGVTFIAYISSSIASTMTAVSLNSGINSHFDLAGRSIAVLTGSVGESYAQAMAFNSRSYPDTDSAINDLLSEKVDAVLDDAPVLEFFDKSHPELPITVVGGIIKPDKYAFALQKGSPLTRRLSLTFVELRESGFLERLSAKYFGTTR